MIDCHFALQTKILTKNTAGNCAFIFDELQSPGNISYANCCWVELATNKVHTLSHYAIIACSGPVEETC